MIKRPERSACAPGTLQPYHSARGTEGCADLSEGWIRIVRQRNAARSVLMSSFRLRPQPESGRSDRTPAPDCHRQDSRSANGVRCRSWNRRSANWPRSRCERAKATRSSSWMNVSWRTSRAKNQNLCFRFRGVPLLLDASGIRIDSIPGAGPATDIVVLSVLPVVTLLVCLTRN